MYRAERVKNGEMAVGYWFQAYIDIGCEQRLADYIIEPHIFVMKASLNNRLKIVDFYEVNPDTLEIKIGDNWFEPEFVESIFKKLGEFGLKKLMKE